MRTAEDLPHGDVDYAGNRRGWRSRMMPPEPGNPSGFSRLVAPFLTLAMRRADRKDLARLEEVLERGAAAQPSSLLGRLQESENFS